MVDSGRVMVMAEADAGKWCSGANIIMNAQRVAFERERRVFTSRDGFYGAPDEDDSRNRETDDSSQRARVNCSAAPSADDSLPSPLMELGCVFLILGVALGCTLLFSGSAGIGVAVTLASIVLGFSCLYVDYNSMVDERNHERAASNNRVVGKPHNSIGAYRFLMLFSDDDDWRFWLRHYRESFWFDQLSPADQQYVAEKLDPVVATSSGRGTCGISGKRTDRLLRVLGLWKSYAYIHDGQDKHTLETINDLDKWLRDEHTAYLHPEQMTDREREVFPEWFWRVMVRPVVRMKNACVRCTQL